MMRSSVEPVAGGAPASVRTGFDIMLVAVLASLFVVGGATALRAVPSPDLSWLLLAAERVLDGARYGADVMEVNPPLVVWMFIPTVALGRWLALPAHSVLVMLTLGLVAVSLVLVNAALTSVLERAHQRSLLIGLATAFLLLPGLDFAQKEHLAALLCAPWIALAGRRADGAPVAMPVVLSAAVVGSLGWALKPHFLFALGAVEAVVLRRRGVRMLVRPELVVLGTAAIAYVALAALLAPDYFDLVRRFRPVYAVYLTQRPLDAVLLSIGAIGLFVYGLVRRADEPVPLVFAAAALGFLLAAVLQMKWWSYHFLAAGVFGVGTAAVLPVRSVKRLRLAATVVVQVLAVALLVRAVVRDVDVIARPWARANIVEPDLRAVRDFLSRAAPGQPVMVLSTNIQSGFPAVPLAGSVWASRLPSLWPLIGLYDDELRGSPEIHYRPPARRTGIEAYIGDIVADDLARWRPAVILVLRYEPTAWHSGGALRFDYLTYFGADPRMAELLADYSRAADVGRYGVLLRRGAG